MRRQAAAQDDSSRKTLFLKKINRGGELPIYIDKKKLQTGQNNILGRTLYIQQQQKKV